MEFANYPFTPGGQRIASGYQPRSFYGPGQPPVFGRGGGLPVRRSAADYGDSDVDNDNGGNGNDDGNGITADQGIKPVAGVDAGPSGIRETFVDDPVTGAPAPSDDGDPGHPPSYTQVDSAQSGVGGPVPWQAEQPGEIPRPYTSPTGGQVWTSDSPVDIGRQTPWPGSDPLD